MNKILIVVFLMITATLQAQFGGSLEVSGGQGLDIIGMTSTIDTDITLDLNYDLSITTFGATADWSLESLITRDMGLDLYVTVTPLDWLSFSLSGSLEAGLDMVNLSYKISSKIVF